MRMTSLLVLSAAFASGCGDKDDDPTDDTDDTEVEADADTDADTDTDTDTDADADTDVEKDWADMTLEERRVYMNDVVTPDMKTRFQAFDADRFATFNCVTCHGSGAQNGTFTMPSADLPALDDANFPQPGDGGIHDFMYNEVTSEMANHLDMPPFDPSTGEGFGCLGCHVVQ